MICVEGRSVGKTQNHDFPMSGTGNHQSLALLKETVYVQETLSENHLVGWWGHVTIAPRIFIQ